MSRRRKEMEMPGTDSFLDVVANLVGILIILVVVIGASAASNWSEPDASDAKQEQIKQTRAGLEKVAREAMNYEWNHREIRSKIETEAALLNARRKQRHQGLIQLEMLNRELNQKKSQLDHKKQLALEQDSEKRQLEAELAKWKSQVASIDIHAPSLSKIEHYPTPVAQTVFNQEYHFELKNGRLTRVPIDELVLLIKRELQVKAEKLRNNQLSSTIETVGPVGNFRMQYMLAARNVRLPAGNGFVTQRTVEFERFIMLPVMEESGSSHQRAMQPGGELHDLVSTIDPNKSTISIWVYPDSYQAYREIKTWLQEKRFQTAVWPLPKGAPISGGPNGFRSASQ